MALLTMQWHLHRYFAITATAEPDDDDLGWKANISSSIASKTCSSSQPATHENESDIWGVEMMFV